ncbi:DMT family transporter [Aquisalimonas asiatica]|uniref:EamA-like transporter family protein n=1 Tax=Aquisalimonas asiatica TaxID=406100 RepID=A0A1H8T204_9GAMM|nr:DMT family transporter [Aquisalimonas asiatica]SEO84553.1 EamA-like transporter family protein [Aquisalimonas asiatica]
MTLPPRLRRLVTLAFVVLASASCFAALKAGLEYAPPLRLVALRLFIGGTTLLALLPVLGIRLLPHRGLWLWIVLLGVAVTAFAYGSMAISLGYTGAGIASVLGNSQPLLAVALGVWLFNEKLTLARLIALLMGIAGVILVAYPVTSALQVEGGLGPLLALASSAGLVAASVVVKHIGSGVSRLVLAAWPLVLGSIPLFLLSLALEPVNATDWSPYFVGVLVFLAIPGTALLTLGWYSLLRHEDLGRLSLYFYAVPAVGLVLSWFLYAEPITGQEFGGVALILGSLVAVSVEEWRAEGSPRTSSTGS